jgi:hypothetical protein
MNRAPTNAIVLDDDIPHTLRPFYGGLAQRTTHDSSKSTPPIYALNVNKPF